MECILQYLDDLEDLVFASALLLERVRRAIRTLLWAGLLLAMPFGTVFLAFVKPPLAIAAASLLSVGMLYRAAVHHSCKGLLRAAAPPLP